MSFNFLISIADCTTRLGTTKIAGFSNFAKQTSKEYSDSSIYLFGGLRFKPDVEAIFNLYIYIAALLYTNTNVLFKLNPKRCQIDKIKLSTPTPTITNKSYDIVIIYDKINAGIFL